ncbi:hypothetical protein PR202_ga12853 [Eleusine coracana subsp. coracana]|uniref:AAA+ ATPase domain-containing protein n=1 Tax=Eleusine coracana subsp. coracana TaxID=191504 RepID=A0AAV5CCS2_ELECO|nr:hypothetical protein PR202_ga12853 [Eleusine coracana subsp. coracana]
MTSYDKLIESYKNAITTAASFAASLMLMRGMLNELVPPNVRAMLFPRLNYLRSHMSSHHTIIIEQKIDAFTNNHVHVAVKTYLATRINTNIQQRLRVSSMDEKEKMLVSMAEGEEMVDMYDGMEFKWCLSSHEISSKRDFSNNGYESQQMVHSFEVRFDKKHKEKALNSYLPFIVSTAKKLKQSIIDDLNKFMKRKDYYKRIGKAWKRGYLLYGPPGTGKSSLVAAIANHLRFDIYDLELTGVANNSDLRRFLIGMTNRSILVVEDIDCSIEMNQREESGSNPTYKENEEHKVTLSGLLNFVDGLWSTCGEGKIIIFTTNYKERLDPALLRPGRMDMHIHMGYCTPESFRILANNYHSVEYHATYPKIEKLIKEVMVTPAEVAEVLRRTDDSDVAFHDLVNLLESKMKDVHEIDTGHNDKRRKLDEKKDDITGDENLKLSQLPEINDDVN